MTHVRAGDRVAYTAPAPLGSYSQERVLDARWLVKLPPAISDQAGAAMMLKGLTAWYLLKRSYRVARGDWILLYAAAGRRRLDRLAVGAASRRARDRCREHAGKARAGARERL